MQSPVPAHLCARLHAHAPDSARSASLRGTAVLPTRGMQSESSEVFLHLQYFYALSWSSRKADNPGERKKAIHATSARLISFQAGGEFKKKLNKHDSFPIIHCETHSITALTVHWSKDSFQTQGKVTLTSAAKLCLTLASRSFSSKNNGREQTHKSTMQPCS